VDKAHYIIFHPESKRQIIDAKASAIENGQVNTAWEGKIYVDRINNGNEDPFVYTHPWLYSYCHATQLRRTPREDGNYLQKDSVIFFVSGDCANKRHLTIDTVFVIENALTWTKKPKLALSHKVSRNQSGLPPMETTFKISILRTTRLRNPHLRSETSHRPRYGSRSPLLLPSNRQKRQSCYHTIWRANYRIGGQNK